MVRSGESVFRFPNLPAPSCPGKCHTTHLTSADQSAALVPSNQHNNYDPAERRAQQAAAQAKAKGKSKAKGKAKALPVAQPKSKAKRSADFIVSLVRGGHLLGNARTWNAVLDHVQPFIASKLVIRTDDTERDSKGVKDCMNRNYALLEQTALKGAPDTKEHEYVKELALELALKIGGGPWTPDSPMA
jgi:hypothetical protein